MATCTTWLPTSAAVGICCMGRAWPTHHQGGETSTYWSDPSFVDSLPHAAPGVGVVTSCS